MNTTAEYQATSARLVREAGAVLLQHFGRVRHIRQKEHPSSVVCEADLQSERLIIQRIRARFPDDAIVAEESGWQPGKSGITWVIDPLDGTSNFVAGLPWFGAQIGVLHRERPLAAAMFLPAQGDLYSGAVGRGVTKNGRPLAVTQERVLKKTLCAFGFDATAGQAQTRRNAALLMRVAAAVRNTRATNSLVDFCYTLEGFFGACINLNCKIWDIVPVSLMLPEAGGRFTFLNGKPVRFRIDAQVTSKTYPILGAAKPLHRQLLRALSVRRTGVPPVPSVA